MAKPPKTSTIIKDLLHHSPKFSHNSREPSTHSADVESLSSGENQDKPIYSTSSFSMCHRIKPVAAFPHISSDLLMSLSNHDKEVYLNTVIKDATSNSERIGIPFMAMKDDRICVMSVGDAKMEFFCSPESWKQRIIDESNETTEIQLLLQGPDKVKEGNKPTSSREKVQKLIRKYTTHDTTASPPKRVPSPIIPVTPLGAVNEKGLRMVGVIRDSPSQQYSVEDTPLGNNRDSTISSVTIRPSQAEKPLPKTPPRHSTSQVVSTPAKPVIRMRASDTDVRSKKGSPSPKKMKPRSPTKQRHYSDLKAAAMTKQNRPRKLRRTSSVLSDTSREVFLRFSEEGVRTRISLS